MQTLIVTPWTTKEELIHQSRFIGKGAVCSVSDAASIEAAARAVKEFADKTVDSKHRNPEEEVRQFTRLSSAVKQASGESNVFSTHVPLTGMVTLVGYTCVQEGYYDLAHLLVGKMFRELGTGKEGDQGKCILEYAADHKEDLTEVPEVVKTVYFKVVAALKKRGVHVKDYSSLSAVRYALGDSKFMDHLASKTLVLQLEDEDLKCVKKALADKGISIPESGVFKAMKRAVKAHAMGTLKAGYEVFSEFAARHRAPSAESLNGVDPKVVEVYDQVEKLLRVAGRAAKEGNWEAYENTLSVIARNLERLSTESEMAQYSVVDRARIQTGLFNWAMSICHAAILVVNGANTFEAALKAGVKSAVTMQAIIDGKLPYTAEEVEEAKERAQNDVNRIFGLASNGSFQSGGAGEEFEAGIFELFKSVNYVSARLAAISDTRKKGDEWEYVFSRQVSGQSMKDWLIDCYRLGNGEKRAVSGKSMAMLLAESLRGNGVRYQPVPFTNKTVGVLPATVNYGDEFTVNYGPKLEDDARLTVTVREGCDLAKARKRLGALGMYPEYFFASSKVAVVEMGREYMHHEAHEGVAFVTESTSGMKCGVYSTFRGFIQYFGEPRMVKAVLTVVPDGTIPEGVIYVTPGSLKTELVFEGESKYFLVGHKADEESVRTNRCWLAQPEIVEACALQEELRTWSKIDAEKVVACAKRKGINNLQCFGAWSTLITELVGNADNPRKLKFDMSWAGVRKFYVRGAMPWEGGMDMHDVMFPVPGCMVVNPTVYERIADICGGADSDDCYTVEFVGDGYIFTRDPNIGLEKARIWLDITGTLVKEVN